VTGLAEFSHLGWLLTLKITEQEAIFSWGRCYEDKFLRFLPIFGEKNIGVFLKNICFGQILAKTSSSLNRKRQYFRQIFRQKYF
jgi:hypothetical protein